MGAADASRSARRGTLPRILIAVVFVGAIVAFFAFGGNEYLHLDTIKRHRDALRAFTESHYAAAIVLAFAVYTAAIAFSLPVAAILSLTTGFLFGRWVGTALVVGAATLGATLLFVAARYLFADAARRRLGATAARINAGFTANAFNYLLFLRLVPLFPFFIVNLAAAFTSIRLTTFVVATALGIVPGSFVYVNFGQALGSIESLHGLLSTQVLASFALLALLALAPVALQKLRGRQSGRRKR